MRSELLQLRIAQADGTVLPFADRTFHAVIIMHPLSNLNPELASAMVHEACRVSGSWVIAEIKDPAILRLQLAIRAGYDNHRWSRRSRK